MWQYIYTKMQKKPLSTAAKQYIKKYAYPLFVVVHDKNLAVFKELVEYNPNLVSSVNGINKPVLCEVFEERNLEMAEILLENGANPDVIFTFFKMPRLLIIQAIAAAHEGFVELLIKHGASVDKEENGLSARKALDNPYQYVKLLFSGNEECAGAKHFLEKAQEMKQLVEQLRPLTPILPTLFTSSAISQLRQRGSAATPTPPPAIPVI